MCPHFWSILICKIRQFWAKNITAHHTFLWSKHPKVTKNPYYYLFAKESLKKVSAHGLYVIIQSNPWNITFNKGATKLYFLNYFHLIIVSFGPGLYKPAFSIYPFRKLGFYLFVFWFFMFLYLWFLAFTFLFYVLNLM